MRLIATKFASLPLSPPSGQVLDVDGARPVAVEEIDLGDVVRLTEVDDRAHRVLRRIPNVRRVPLRERVARCSVDERRRVRAVLHIDRDEAGQVPVRVEVRVDRAGALRVGIAGVRDAAERRSSEEKPTENSTDANRGRLHGNT